MLEVHVSEWSVHFEKEEEEKKTSAEKSRSYACSSTTFCNTAAQVRMSVGVLLPYKLHAPLCSTTMVLLLGHQDLV